MIGHGHLWCAYSRNEPFGSLKVGFIQTASQVKTLPRVTLGKGGDQLVEHIINPKCNW